MSLRLFALMNYHSRGQAISAQVLCEDRDTACMLFSEEYEFDDQDPKMVVELGGLDLPYVKEMVSNELRFHD